MMKPRLSTGVGLTLLVATPAFGQNTPSCDGPQDACRQIVEVTARYNAAFNNHDLAGLSALFTADTVGAWPGGILHGQEARENLLTDLLKAGWANHAGGPDQVHVIGDWGWAVGTWTATPPGAKDTTHPAWGTWGEVVVRQDGVWKIRMQAWNVAGPDAKQAQPHTSSKR
jgi:ketosteroid isomerase-like protein